jgi:hypothetical protein
MIHRIVASGQVGRTLARLMLVASSCVGLIALDHDGPAASASGLTVRVTHIMGFEDISNNANGELSIQDDDLRFEKSSGPGAQISIGSIQDVFLGVEDKQIGGTPMALTRAAVPFGGGRVVGLFAHKKYETVTLQYTDPNGGLHGAIFQLNKGQGKALQNGS